jgi:peptidoglycan/LPS O-acetylase OafA/YrhL
MSVALMHLFDEASPKWRAFDLRYFNPGAFGVIVFFLVSGFVIPMSLERRGSVVAFVVSRVFRLYPLYWASLLAVVLFYKLRIGLLMFEFTRGLTSHVLWNATMIQHWVGVPDAVGLYWTLAFELLFYAATVVLFALKLHRRTDFIVAFGAAYFVVRGVLLPLLGLGADISDSFLVLTFFVGTLWYRGWSRAFSAGHVAWITVGFVGAFTASQIATFVVLKEPVNPGGVHPVAMLSGWAAAYATFALLLWTRAGARGRFLPWLGRVSYSIYLLHGVLLLIPLPLSRVATLIVRLLVLLPLSAVTHRFVEQNGILAGRSLLGRISARARG